MRDGLRVNMDASPLPGTLTPSREALSGLLPREVGAVAAIVLLEISVLLATTVSDAGRTTMTLYTNTDHTLEYLPDTGCLDLKQRHLTVPWWPSGIFRAAVPRHRPCRNGSRPVRKARTKATRACSRPLRIRKPPCGLAISCHHVRGIPFIPL